ncbi:MAG: FAD-dependent oxidoreductase [Erysipelotrichaceae bacterium]|nr:FAD-dependent oxidoreductase [Erysipelotrichaceae bacterium]
MLRYGIPSYKLEKDVIKAEIDIMKEMGVEIKTGINVGKDITISELRKQGYKGFYIAIGCQGGRYPNVENDHAEGTMTAVEFLSAANTGNLKIDEDVVVVGGGNVAIDAARVSRRSGAKSVNMLCLETEDIMPASKEEISEAREDGVNINCGWGPKEVLTKDSKVSGIIFKKCTSVYDENGKFSPSYDENETISIPCTKIVFAIGQAIEWGDLLNGEDIEYWHGNYPVADKLTYQTKVEDIFVGGDVYTGPKFAIDAIAQGHEAAESLHRYVQHGHMTIGRNRREFIELDKDDISVVSYDTAGRQEPTDTVSDNKFEDVHGTLTEEQVRIETSRCLGCGATIVDTNKCIGCGICTTKCKFDAIHLTRDFPEASTMRVAEEKFNYIIPYAAKRGVKILFNKKDKD